MAPPSQKILTWLHNVLVNEYRDVDRTYSDVVQALTFYPWITLRTEVYTFENGVSSLLLNLRGPLPVTFRAATYAFPISLWIPRDYPQAAPLGFVTPTKDIVVRPGQHVSGEGRIYHPYLAAWRRERSNLAEWIAICQDIFSKEPPVIARPQHIPQASSSQQHHPVAGPPPPPLPPELERKDTRPNDAQSLGQSRSPPPPPPKPFEIHGSSNSYSSKPPPPLPPQPFQPKVAHKPSPGQRNDVSGSMPRPYNDHPFEDQGYASRGQPSYTQPSIQQNHPLNWLPQRSNEAFSPAARNFGNSISSQPSQISSRKPEPAQASEQSYINPGHPPSDLRQASYPPAGPLPIVHSQPIPHPQPQRQKQKPPEDLLTSPFEAPLPAPNQNIAPPPIPPNPEKDALLAAISQNLGEQVQSLHNSTASAIAPLRIQQTALINAINALDVEMSQLNELESFLSSNEAILRQAMRDADAVLEDAKRRKVPHVDEVLIAPSVVSRQLYENVAEERSIEDCRNVLAKALDRGRISGNVWAKQTRSLAREEFFKKALINKMSRGLGLVDESMYH